MLNPSQSSRKERVVNLVSNAPADKIHGLDDFLRIFNKDDVRAEIKPFRYVIQRRVKRGLGGKFSKGLSTEVTENVEINPNQDMLGLRRWLGAIRHDASNVMLLNVNKVRDDALAAPLIFSQVFKTGRPILITGADQTAQDQLLGSIDLNFARVATTVAQNHTLKSMLLERTKRPKGFVNSVRQLLEFEFLPQAIRDKIMKINSGGDPSELSEAELVNICLLADLASRYQVGLETFRDAVQNSRLQLPQLMSQFDLITSDFSVEDCVEEFKAYLESDSDEPIRPESRSQVFSYINRYLSSSEGGSRGSSRLDRANAFLKTLCSAVIRRRAKLDPFLFKRCYFLGDRQGTERDLYESIKPFFQALTKVIRDGGSEMPAEFSDLLSRTMHRLGGLALQSPEQLRTEGDFARQRAANRILGLFQLPNFSLRMTSDGKGGGEAPKLEQVDQAVKGAQLSRDDLRKLGARLRPVLLLNETVAAELHKSTLDVMLNHARAREKSLQDVYVINAVSELVNYSFHLGDQGISSMERLCGLNVVRSRLGLDFTPTSRDDDSIGIFASEKEPPLGTLTSDFQLVRRAYTELVSRQAERHVKKVTDHKINYLQATYGEKFFEIVHDNVVSHNDLPLSRNQLAAIMRQRNVLGNLDAKGWRSGAEDELGDPFLLLESQSAKAEKDLPGTPEEFGQRLGAAAQKFRQLLNGMKQRAEADARETNPDGVLWPLFKKGIYNLARPEAREAFRRSAYYRYLQEWIAKVSSANYSVFHSENLEAGIKVFVPSKFAFVLLIGSRFSFIMEQKVVRYQLLASPTDKPQDMDPVSRVVYEKLTEMLSGQNQEPEFAALAELGERIGHCTQLWREYGSYLAFSLLDRVLSDTVMKQLQPGKIAAKNLLYLPDSRKVCLGQTSAAGTVPFSKILQNPENMGNLQKNPTSASTTIDDFTITVHSIVRLREELTSMQGIAEDLLEIVQNISHDRSESASMQDLENRLGQLVRLLEKPVRELNEKDVQALHVVASHIRASLQVLLNSPSPQKQRAMTHLQAQFKERRSDSHSIRLNFADAFILDKTSIRVMQKVQQGDEIVSRSRKVEVEVEAQYQTLSLRIRECIRFQELLQRKRHIVLAPEGQKRKQLDYVMDIMDILLAMRGQAITFYVDTSILAEEQVMRLATRVKPHNFFRMEDLQPEVPEGMKAKFAIDPLTGRPMLSAPPAQSPPAR